MGRHHGDDELGVVQGGVHVPGDGERVGEGAAGEVTAVLPGGLGLGGAIGAVVPQPDLVAAAPELHRQGCSPRARAQDGAAGEVRLAHVS